MTDAGVPVEVVRRLSPRDVSDVIDLAGEVAQHDGSAPFAEHVMLHLRRGGDDHARHLLVRDDHGVLVGYAHLDVSDHVEGPSGELAVRPGSRRQGVGHALVEELAHQTSLVPGQRGRLRLWAHGENAPAGQLASSLGFTRSRVLWQMRRSLYAALAPARLPDGITVRPFRPGEDDDAWLALNSRAFAHLPDQGSWTVDDLRLRMAEPWFDPAGFLLAQDKDGNLVGFHWTKVHGADGSGAPLHHHDHGAAGHHAHEAIGEVYVVGVDPAWQGTGLGRALVLAGLHHLRSLPRGLSQAMLYVDAGNVRAIRLYESLGFTRWDTDVSYREPAG